METHHSLSLGQNLKIHAEIGSWCLAPSLSSKLISLGPNPGVFEVCGRGPIGVCECQALVFTISWALEMIRLEDMAAIPPFIAKALSTFAVLRDKPYRAILQRNSGETKDFCLGWEKGCY